MSILAPEIAPVVHWYFAEVFGTQEGPGILPFYCDPNKVGWFAVSPQDLSTGRAAAVFKLLVALSMFQGLRDVVIMRQQRAFSRESVRGLATTSSIKRSIAANDCSVLASAETFESGCSVAKRNGAVDCGRKPGASCHVKEATRAFNRMGDFGKLPTSAWLSVLKEGGIERIVRDVVRREEVPTQRAAILVERFATIHRIGRKLATLFVSVLATPALAPGLTPWFPRVDGNELVVVDTNVARATDALRSPGAPRTYDARARWIREQAAEVDLQLFEPSLPSYSPRIVQQALYAFCSLSNRVARGDVCAKASARCHGCVSSICPFATHNGQA